MDKGSACRGAAEIMRAGAEPPSVIRTGYLLTV
jgi:hypothetical protein